MFWTLIIPISEVCVNLFLLFLLFFTHGGVASLLTWLCVVCANSLRPRIRASFYRKKLFISARCLRILPIWNPLKQGLEPEVSGPNRLLCTWVVGLSETSFTSDSPLTWGSQLIMGCLNTLCVWALGLIPVPLAHILQNEKSNLLGSANGGSGFPAHLPLCGFQISLLVLAWRKSLVPC